MMIDKFTPIPENFLTELAQLSEHDKQLLSPALQDFLLHTQKRQAMLDTAHQKSFNDPYWQTVRPSMIRTFTKGVSYWTSVDIVDADMWGITIRSALEGFGIKVNRFPVGRAQHAVNVLSGAESTAPYIILGMHGDEGKLLLDELAEEVAATEQFNNAFTPEDLHTFVDLPGRVVISLGCDTGTPELARAFLDHGCTAYIAPEGAPFGYASFFVPVFLFYELTEMRSLDEAVERLRKHDQELSMWRLFR